MTTQTCRRGNYIIKEIEVDLVVVVQVWQVGAHFKALVKLESLVPLVLPCIFFTSQTRPPEHCGTDCTLDTFAIGDPDIGAHLSETFRPSIICPI